MANQTALGPSLAVKEIGDLYARDNFKNLTKFFDQESQLVGFKFIEVVFEEAEEDRIVPHGLNYIPKDIVKLQIGGNAVVTFNRSKFTRSNLSISSNGAARIRFLVGTYSKDIAPTTPPENDQEDWYANFPNVISTTTVTSNYQIETQDSFVLVSSGDEEHGAAVTVTLPDATLTKGKQYTIRKNDDNFIQHIVKTLNGQSLNFVAAGTFNLCTSGDTLTVLSNGIGYLITNHDYPRVFVPYDTAWTADTANPTIGNGTLNALWRRDGDSIEVRIKLVIGGASTMGTDSWHFSLPTGLTMDTSLLYGDNQRDNFIGHATHWNFGVGLFHGPVAKTYGHDTHVELYSHVSAVGGAISSVTSAVPFTWGSGDVCTIMFKVPITGWEG